LVGNHAIALIMNEVAAREPRARLPNTNLGDRVYEALVGDSCGKILWMITTL